MKITSPNYTQIPNDILDNMDELSDIELRTLLTICRQTFGWQRQRCKASISFIVGATGLSTPAVVKATKSLLDRELLTRFQAGDSYEYEVTVTEQPLNAVKTPSKPHLDPPLNVVKTPPLNAVKTNKEIEERKTKEKHREEFLIPLFLNVPTFVAAWNDWMEYRRQLKNPVTRMAAKHQLEMLERLGSVALAVESINRSIMAGWSGLFEPRDSSVPSPRTTKINMTEVSKKHTDAESKLDDLRESGASKEEIEAARKYERKCFEEFNAALRHNAALRR